MGQFRASANDFASTLGAMGSKIYSALKSGIEDYDYDSKWIVKPSGGVFTHGLTTLPRFVQIQGSDSVDGSGYVTENASSVTTSQITVGGAKAYYRVLANR